MALTRWLELSVESSRTGEESLQEAQKTIAALQEEVSTTASNYDVQLSTMSCNYEWKISSAEGDNWTIRISSV